MPHLRLAASENFKGKSRRGLYGDVIEEIDFNVGRILNTVRELGLEEDTYIIFTSDNGPWFLDRHPALSKQKDQGGSHGGDSAPLRGHKTSTWEGGVRVPCVMWAPGRIPEGLVSAQLTTTMDILPTLAHLADGNLPRDRIIDGKNISDLMHGKTGAKSETVAFYYYGHTQLMAVRSDKWKLHLPRSINTMERWNVFHRESDIVDFSKPHLYNLEDDPGEQNNLAETHPEIVKDLMILADRAKMILAITTELGRTPRFFDPQARRTDIRDEW